MEIVGLPKEHLRDVWPHIEGYLESFEKRAAGELTAADLVVDIMRGTRQAWLATDGKEVKALALTRIEGPPLKTTVIDFCTGRDREEWRDKMVAAINEWGKALGSRRFRIICRPGWAPELKPLGFRETHRVLERDI